MSKSTKLLIGMITLAVSAFAQAPPTAPQFILSGAVGFDQYAKPKFSGEVSAAVRVSGNTYSLTGYSMLAKSSTATTGVMQQIYANGRVSLYAIGTAGAAMADNAAQMTGMAGGLLTYHGFLSRAPGLFVYGKVAGAYSAQAGAHPVFFVGFGWRSQ